MLKKASAVSLLAITLVLALASTGCAQYVWHTYNGNQYALTLHWQPWVDNEAEAVGVGGHLVAINDEAENMWLATTFADSYAEAFDGDPNLAGAQIGYYLNPATSQWEWINGDPVTYTNHFNRPETNQYFPEGGIHGYLHVYPHEFAPTWNAGPGHTEPGYPPGSLMKGIIERPIPEPTSLVALLCGLSVLSRRRTKR